MAQHCGANSTVADLVLQHAAVANAMRRGFCTTVLHLSLEFHMITSLYVSSYGVSGPILLIESTDSMTSTLLLQSLLSNSRCKIRGIFMLSAESCFAIQEYLT